jgi:hypothetical protein
MSPFRQGRTEPGETLERPDSKRAFSPLRDLCHLRIRCLVLRALSESLICYYLHIFALLETSFFGRRWNGPSGGGNCQRGFLEQGIALSDNANRQRRFVALLLKGFTEAKYGSWSIPDLEIELNNGRMHLRLFFGLHQDWVFVDEIHRAPSQGGDSPSTFAACRSWSFSQHSYSAEPASRSFTARGGESNPGSIPTSCPESASLPRFNHPQIQTEFHFVSRCPRCPDISASGHYPLPRLPQ